MIHKKLLKEDRDYVISPKYNNSLEKFIKDNPDGVKDKVICKMLDITEDELESIYMSAILKLRKYLK